MQPMQLCILSGRRFEITFENAQWRKVKEMQVILLLTIPLLGQLIAASRADVLRTHLTTHSGEKSEKCNQCDYASFQAGDLRIHLKMHTGEKSNKCNQCDYASSRASDSRTHLKTHSGEKSNKCNQCDYASSEASNLRTHFSHMMRKVILEVVEKQVILEYDEKSHSRSC